ncbi:polysaccharide lyase 8 family protein [Paenibacillus sp. PAMC21692]|uniref:polysaccharide lyase 8 family protein n=1 Tax=Paenibacillus sp. PAMC21692 TaxID=2762320 RepID=UPI00164DE557|nr:polysaccharide lyase 8 family protein [Paenibacillus sp. PAMC21692]QNK57916.1 polysaccharide lyase 8 family protein [Paenibacillus sp. PAMC21692]
MNCSELRLKWKDMLIASPVSSRDEADADLELALQRISDEARSYADTIHLHADRSCLWQDLSGTQYDLAIFTSYRRIKALALAYATAGCQQYHETVIFNHITDALEWLHLHHYNADNYGRFRLWWHVEIGIPLEINDCLVLLYDKLSPAFIRKHAEAILRFSPDPVFYNYSSTAHYGTKPSTGANRLWKCSVHAILGSVLGKPSMLAAATSAVLPVLDYSAQGDGFHRDGSFVQHDCYAYNGGYGKAFLSHLVRLLNWLKGSEWEITDDRTGHLFHWIEEGFLPLVYKGALMDMSRGREIARSYSQDHEAGHQLIDAIVEAIPLFPHREVERWKVLVAYWIRSDTYRRYYSYATPRMIRLAKQVEQEAGQLPPNSPSSAKVYAAMDRVAYVQPDYGFSVSMYSSRTAAYECISRVNRKGWHTTHGMTQLYTQDLDQFSEGFWPTVDMQRLPGTTVDRSLKPEEYGAGKLSSKSWVGGVELEGKFAAAGMELEGLPDLHGEHPGRSLNARKSWFLLGEIIVCLGSDIRMDGDHPVETIVDNRRLHTDGGGQTTVNGRVNTPEEEGAHRWQSVRSIHLTGFHNGADIGYYFPEQTPVMVIRETRTGSWSDIGIEQRDQISNGYLTLVLEHGIRPVDGQYCYAILPGASQERLLRMEEHPAFEVLENSSQAHAVRHSALGLTGVNFWGDAQKTVGSLTVNAKSSVMLQESDTDLIFSVADPTQLNKGIIEVIIDSTATGIVAIDPVVKVHELSPRIRLSVDVRGSCGRSARIKLQK